MKVYRMLICLSFLFVFITSCSVQKRYHRKGYTVTWNKDRSVHKRKKQSTEANKKKDTLNRNVFKLSSQLTNPKPNLELSQTEKSESVNNSLRTEKVFEIDSCKQIQPRQNKIIVKLKSSVLQNRATIKHPTITQNGVSNNLKHTKKLKPTSFDGAGRSLGIAGIFLLVGLIIGLLGVLLSVQILGLISVICLGISGLFFMLFIFEGLLTILTFGML